MTQTEGQEVEPVGKYQRSIRLTQDMAARLHAVCEHLGVSVGSYLTQKIGEAVSKDETSLLVKQSKDGSLEMIAKLFGEMMAAEQAAEAASEQKAKPRGKA